MMSLDEISEFILQLKNTTIINSLFHFHLLLINLKKVQYINQRISSFCVYLFKMISY